MFIVCSDDEQKIYERELPYYFPTNSVRVGKNSHPKISVREPKNLLSTHLAIPSGRFLLTNSGRSSNDLSTNSGEPSNHWCPSYSGEPENRLHTTISVKPNNWLTTNLGPSKSNNCFSTYSNGSSNNSVDGSSKQLVRTYSNKQLWTNSRKGKMVLSFKSRIRHYVT